MQSDSKFSVYFGLDVLSKIRPERAAASNPYPNPVGKEFSTTFNVALPDSKSFYEVTLKLFDGKGVEVESIARTLDPGLHILKYDLSQHIGNGMWFYRLVINSNESSLTYSGKIIVP